MQLTRVSDKPILQANPANTWEAAAVFNCAAVMKDGKVNLIYRATNASSNGAHGIYYNSLGRAVSDDGIHFSRKDRPVLAPADGQESRGPEDPRIVLLEGKYQMLYTGYGGRFPSDWRICRAESTDLLNWKRKGVVLDEPNKDAALFPRKINGRYVMLHRRPPDIWITDSADMITWENHRIIMQPITGSSWENSKIGISGPPFLTDDGWVLIYHGVGDNADNDKKVYSQGIALLDKDDPSKVLYRQNTPILKPELDWEVNGYVPNVVFSCGQVIKDNKLWVYYAGADTAIGAAVVKMDSLFS